MTMRGHKYSGKHKLHANGKGGHGILVSSLRLDASNVDGGLCITILQQLAGLDFVEIRLSGLLVVTYGRAQPIIKIVFQ